MIDPSEYVFHTLASAVRAEYPEAFIVAEPYLNYTKYPFIEIVEMDNVVYRKGRELDYTERYSLVHFQIRIISNKRVGKAKEAKSIQKIVNDKMSEMGFLRLNATPVLSEGQEHYQLVLRYRGIIRVDDGIVY